MLARTYRNELLHTAGRNVNWRDYFGKEMIYFKHKPI